MPASSASPARESRDAFDSRPSRDSRAVPDFPAAADLLAGQYELQDQWRDRLDHDAVAASADHRQLHAHLHRRKLVFRLHQFAEICDYQYDHLDFGRSSGGLRVFAVSLPRRQASVLLAVVEPDGAGRGLCAAVLQSLFGDQSVRHAVGGGAGPLHLQRPPGGVDPGRVRVRGAARNRRNRVSGRLLVPAVFRQDTGAADRQRHRRRGVLLLHVFLGRIAAGAHADLSGGQADLGGDDPHRFRGRNGLGLAGCGRRPDHHPRRAGDLVRPQLHRARLRARQGLGRTMENIAWMAWTPPTAIFFVLLSMTLAVMTWLAVAYPEAERVGILRIPKTRGERVVLSLIMTAVIHLLWIGLVGTDPIAALPVRAGIELSSLWLASVISLVSAVAIFRTV